VKREADTNTSASAAGSENWGHTKENLSKFPGTIYYNPYIYTYTRFFVCYSTSPTVFLAVVPAASILVSVSVTD